jgi:thiosulfate sulfurtransferase
MSEFQHINGSDLIAMLEEGSVQIVDIRDAMSFQQGHITGAKHLDNNTVEQFVTNADPDQPVVVCCYHGNSSQQAAAYLNSRGFKTTYSLDGGFALWGSAYPDRVEH